MSDTTMWVLFFFFILQLTCAGAENITGVVGENVNLTCKVLNNNPVSVVDWTRPDLNPDQVLLCRNKTFDHHYQNPSFQNRVDLLDLQKGDVSLILRNLKMNDTGTYECHVRQEGTNHHKRDTDHLICTIKLSVVPAGDKDEVKEEEEDSRSHSWTYWTVALVVTAALVVLVVLVGVVVLILKRRQNNSSSRPDEPADVEMNPLNHDDRNKQAEPS